MQILKNIFNKLFKNTKGIKIHLDEAIQFEEAKDYESACYAYAGAIAQGENDNQYKDKIRNLCKTYGPFTFEKQLTKIKKEFCTCCESCGEGYHKAVLMPIINKELNQE